MKKHHFISIIISSLFALLLTNCADKLDLSVFNSDGSGANIGGDTLYIKLSPDWTGFNKPQDIIVGSEPFLYIADTDNDRVVMMNLDGQILGTRTIKRPVALAQDYKLNLIVCAQFDTTLPSGETKTFGAVYKINLTAASHRINEAPIIRLLPRAVDFNNPGRQYTGAAVFYDNSFYIARTGPGNTSIIDPDNSILIFQQKKRNDGTVVDTLIGRMPNFDPLGSGIISANQISSLTSFKKKNIDFLITLIGNNSFKAQWLTFVETQLDARYQSELYPGASDLMAINKFARPEGTAIDDAGNIYVADAAKDSIFKFNPFGYELQSFGGSAVFKSPHAVALFDRTLYVADTDNNRILRFILSTDIR